MANVNPTPQPATNVPSATDFADTDVFDLSSLARDPNQNNLYDLTTITFNNLPAVFYQYVVEAHEEMRIDLISYELYNSIEYMDFLLDINDIDNPLNIKTGDTIKYVDVNQISTFQLTNTQAVQTQQILLNVNKATQVDNNRQTYLNNNYSLPPTFLENPAPSVTSNGNIITIGGNS